MKKCLFVIDSLVTGGTSKVLINLLKGFDYSKYEVDLLVLNYHGDMKDMIPSEVNVIKGSKFFSVVDLNFKSLIKSFSFLKLIRKSYIYFLNKTGLIEKSIKMERRKILDKKYDVEISYNDGICTLFLGFGDSIKKVNWVHTDYSVNNFSHRYGKTVLKALDNIDVNVGVSQEVSEGYRAAYNLEKMPLVILNIIDDLEIILKSEEEPDILFPKDEFSVVSVGRLVPQKAYLRYIDVHKKLIDEGCKFKFYLIGDGPEYNLISQKIRENEIEDSFILMGQQLNPFMYLKQADLFLLVSKFEGMPTVVFESLILNVPVVSTRVAGINHLLNNGEYGLVVDNDADSIYEGMKKILDDKQLYSNYLKKVSSYKIANDESYKMIYELIDK